MSRYMATVRKVWVLCLITLVALALLNAVSVHWEQHLPRSSVKLRHVSTAVKTTDNDIVPSSTIGLVSTTIRPTSSIKSRRVSTANKTAEGILGTVTVHHQQLDMPQAPLPGQQSSDIEDLVDMCIRMTHLNGNLTSFQKQWAKKNAKYLLEEFRRVIPEKSLDGYGNHCWRESFFVQWDTTKYSGHIGNISFHGMVSFSGQLFYYLNTQFPFHQFSTNLICLPNVYMVGFPKCGSSYAYCLINKLILLGGDALSTVKEPRFWVVKTVTIPSANDVGSYFLNFIPRLQHFAELDGKRSPSQLLLVDGAVNKMFKWPQFTQNEGRLVNYCILPAVMPRLLPNSKYITVMREPVSMLYSTFWYSCSRLKGAVSKSVQSKGPDLFHERVVQKLHLFNDCMRDRSVHSLSQACELGTGHNYSSCILQRLHLLDTCAQRMSLTMYSSSSSMPACGRLRMTMGLYFVHIRKWLSIVPKEKFIFLLLDDLVNNLTSSVQDILYFLGVDGGTKGQLKHLAESCDTNDQQEIPYKDDPTLQIRKDTRVLLETFYEPFNMLLAQLIGKELPWHY